MRIRATCPHCDYEKLAIDTPAGPKGLNAMIKLTGELPEDIQKMVETAKHAMRVHISKMHAESAYIYTYNPIFKTENLSGKEIETPGRPKFNLP